MLGCIAALGACTATPSLRGSSRVTVDGRAGWAVLPLRNLSSTPLAGHQASALIQTRLHGRGVAPLASVPDVVRPTLAALLADRDDGEAARDAARNAGHRYALGGSVHEWQYKGAPDREPVVGVSLRLEDLLTGQVLWQASEARTGWGRASLSTIGDRVIADLLAELRIESAPSR